MVDPETGNCIVFNGEIYNFLSLRSECEAQGDKFRTRTDTEVILALYRHYGVDCLKRLRGMFAFAIWDEKNERLFLARDRVGKKPLNYALVNGGIVFCSELAPLARHPEIAREIDLEALELYLQLEYIPAPWTIYKYVRKLLPAHYAIFDCSEFTSEEYWNVDYTKKISLTEQEALEGLEEKLTEAITLRMIADVPLGALLSGGVDSSVVVALMAKLSGEPVRTFSIGFREGAFNELPHAQKVAEICHTAHRPEIVDGDVEPLLSNLARHYGEPFADSSAVPSFFVCEVARRHITVVLNGDGGDELLGGYPRYWLRESNLKLARILGRFTPPWLLVALTPLLLGVKSIPVRSLRKVLIQGAHPELQSLLMHAEFWNDAERCILLPTMSGSELPAWRRVWLEGAFAHADNPVDRMLWYDTHTYLPGDLLVKMDIASMHCGLEARSPLLDHELIEFCASLPVKFKIRNGTGKYLLKKLAERYFPADFVHRPKMGFGIPLAEWLRGPLHKVLTETLLDPESMAPLSASAVKHTLREFQAGNQAHQSRLWALLIYGIWRREQWTR
jgi:asparagine synthase (glutamine-hydrolysing)